MACDNLAIPVIVIILPMIFVVGALIYQVVVIPLKDIWKERKTIQRTDNLNLKDNNLL